MRMLSIQYAIMETRCNATMDKVSLIGNDVAYDRKEC